MLVTVGAAHADPKKTINRDAVEKDFFSWVATMEQNHQAHITADTAEMTFQDFNGGTLAAANTLVVGAGGYKTVQSAVNDAASGGSRTIIQINSGTYRSEFSQFFDHRVGSHRRSHANKPVMNSACSYGCRIGF